MRRHYGPYFKGLENIKAYRMRLVESMDPKEIESILDEIYFHYKDKENIYAKSNTPTEYHGVDG
jgi:hypothetical protein